MLSGVGKSGSPMLREMTSGIDAMMSKKRRMPDEGMASIRRDTARRPRGAPR